MAKRVQLVRHDNVDSSAFLGKLGEITVNTSNNSLIVHDSVTVGGFEQARADLDNVAGATNLVAGKMTAAHVVQQETNTADISTNAADIATNAANISANTANITTNASNISANTAAIFIRANKIVSPVQNNLCKQDATGDLANADSISDNGAEVAIATGRTLNIVDLAGFKIAGAVLTATIAELNKLDGFNGVVADLNILSGIVAAGLSQAELLVLNGLTSTTTELNKLDGFTGGFADLNKLVGITAGTILTTGDEGSGNGIDSDTLDGQEGTYYTNATNLVAGTLSEARLPAIAADGDFTGGLKSYRHNDLTHATSLSVDAIISTAWEDIGPTGSANVWTALDAVPLSAISIRVKLKISVAGSTLNDGYAAILHIRNNGSTIDSTPTSRTIVAEASITNRSGSSEDNLNYTEINIPVDANNRFEAYFDTVGTSPTFDCVMYLMGWDEV